jgi:hypothetical protein
MIAARLRPFMEGFDITVTLHREWVYRAVCVQGQFVGYRPLEQWKRG